MNEIVPQDTPQRQCPDCKQWFPATPQHFYRNKAREEKKRTPIPIVTITCSRCGQQFQRRQFHVSYRSKRASVTVYCSDCSANRRGKADSKIIAEAYQQGQTMEQIATNTGISLSTVRYNLIKMGVTIRPATDGMVARIREHGSNNKGKKASEATRKRQSEASTRQQSRPEAKEFRRKQMRQMLMEGKFSYASKLEDRVAEELSRQGVTFRRQYPINTPGTKGCIACVDFLLTDSKVIEVNGTYWHADPRKYPNGPIYHAQHDKVKSYTRKLQALTEMGITVIELWEIDLNADMAGTIARALGSPS